MRQHIFRLNRAEIRMRDRQTLLHAVCGSEDAFAVEDEPGLAVPCIPAIRLLIECGASLNSRDIRGNTPLHIIATHRNGSVASEVIFLLLGAGAHVDCVNVFGNAPIDIAYTDAACQIFQSQIPLTLRCMAAKAVMDYNIQFENQIPKTLIDFVYWHGIRNKRS
ncbi:Fem-1-like protein B [Gryllus bimaculatus]|nr:Fem-1-like protein B [Gryllus bimaculatus]